MTLIWQRESHMHGMLYMQGKTHVVWDLERNLLRSFFPRIMCPNTQSDWFKISDFFIDKIIFRGDCCRQGRCYEMVGCVDPDDLSARLFKVRKNDYYNNWDLNSRLLVKYGIRLRMSVLAVNAFPTIISWRQHQSNQIQAILVILLQHVLPASDS